MASRSWNRVELIGNLTRDPELRFTPNGAAVCTFGLATNRTFITDGEKREEVDFHRLVSWNKLAELCNQLLKKGTKVFISGRLQTRSWEGQDGIQRQTTEIVVEDMIILSAKTVIEPLGSPPDSLPAAVSEGMNTEEVAAQFETKPKEKEESKPKEAKQTPTPPQEEVKDDGDLPF